MTHTPDSHDSFSVALRSTSGYEQQVDFGAPFPALLLDEPAPLGHGAGPTPAKLLAAAVAGCLGASLLFCLRRARIDVLELRTSAEGTFVRNERGRKRVGAIAVKLEPVVAEADLERVPRCAEVFEEFCVVTASVRNGIDVTVTVEPSSAPVLAGR